jgi:hypothetical protein
MRAQCRRSACVVQTATLAVALGLSLTALAGAADPAAGGRVLSAAVAGTSPAAVLRAGLADARTAAGAPLTVLGATRSTDGTLSVALFRTAGRTAIAGILFAEYAPGGSRATIAYDRADRFATTEPALVARAMAAAQPPASPAVALRDVRSPDRSVIARVPASWRITTFAQGEFAAAGPDAAEVDQEVSVRLIDPRSSVYQQALRFSANPYATPYGIPMTIESDPVRAYVHFASMVAHLKHLPDPAISIERAIPQPAPDGFHATEIVGTESLHGVRTRFDGIVGVASPGPIGGWSIVVKMVSAPVAHFASDLPTLAAVYNSYRVDQGVRGGQVAQTQADDRAGAERGLALMQQTQAATRATFSASMANLRGIGRARS